VLSEQVISPPLEMAQNLTMLVGENSTGNNSTTNSNENNNSSNTSVNFKPKDTNGWRDYKKLKTYLILKDQQSEKVTALKLSNNSIDITWY